MGCRHEAHEAATKADGQVDVTTVTFIQRPINEATYECFMIIHTYAANCVHGVHY